MSVLKVGSLQNLEGTATFNVGTIGGNILEYITCPCDGSIVQAQAGPVTFQNVTTQQTAIYAYTDANGSVVTYTPPAGASTVVYKWSWSMYWAHDHAISHWKFFIDNTEILYARFNRSGRYPEDRYSFEWPVRIGGSENTNTGVVSSWDSPKTLKLQWRAYGTSNARHLHGTNYWDGAGSNQFCMPTLTLIAIK